MKTKEEKKVNSSIKAFVKLGLRHPNLKEQE
jgi:hypothetical protein